MPNGVEIKKERAVGAVDYVRDAGRDEIDPQHVGGALVPGPRPDRRAGRPIGKEAPQSLGDVRW